MALFHAFLKSLMYSPFRWKTQGTPSKRNLFRRSNSSRSSSSMVLPPVAKCTKTNGLKMYQGQFWANFRRGDAEEGSAPAADVRPLLAGWGSASHRPPEYKASC